MTQNTDPRLPDAPLLDDHARRLRVRLYELFRGIQTQFNAIANGYYLTVVTVTADYTVQIQDQIILVNNTGAVAIALPAAADTLHKRLLVKKTSNNAAVITISAASGNIDGAASTTIAAAYGSAGFVSDGTNYFIA